MAPKELLSECKRGDKQKACLRAGVSRTVLDTALKKATMEACTDGEIRVLNELQKIKEERRTMLASLKKQP